MTTKTSPSIVPFVACLGAALLALGAQAQGLTRDNGAPVGDNQNSQTAGPDGPVLLQDVQLIQKLQRFDRERIPERVVHARGTGAHGNHSPETLRDPRGFATKFYTSEGNWDLVGNNLPVFFIRDAIKFPDMVHSLQPGPDTNLQDPNRFFDFFSHVSEAMHMLTRLYSDLGTPASYRTMDGNGVHAYKFVNAQGQATYVKFHWKSLQGEKKLTNAEAGTLQGKTFSHATEDLVQAIRRGEFPKWDLYVQLLKPEQLDGFDFNPLDATKVWTGVAERKVGTFTLNRNPATSFRMLQGRIFSYNDTQLYRVGTNVLQLPINAPKSALASNNQDGAGNAGARDGSVTCEPSRIQPRPQDAAYKYSSLTLKGGTQQARIAKTLKLRQAGDLKQVRDETVKYTMLSHFYKADAKYGEAIARAVKADTGRVE